MRQADHSLDDEISRLRQAALTVDESQKGPLLRYIATLEADADTFSREPTQDDLAGRDSKYKQKNKRQIADPDRNCVLYRFYDDQDNLLYVGRSIRIWSRISEHQRDSRFFPVAAFITLERGFSSEDELDAAERKAIQRERPRWNSKHNDVLENFLRISPQNAGNGDVAQ